MTIVANQFPREDHTGTGSVTAYTFNWRITDKTQVEVIKVSAIGVGTTLTVDTDYTVAGIGDASGSVTPLVAVAITESLVILRKQTLEQGSVYTTENFPPGRMERDLDKIVMALQMMNEQFRRSVRFGKVVAQYGEADAPVDGLFLYWDAALQKFRWAAPAATNVSIPVAIGDGGTGGTSAAQARANLDLEAGVDFPSLATFEAHKDRHKSGGGDAFAAADLLEAVIKRLRQTGSPSAGATTDLTIGAWADGQFLRRSGTTAIGASILESGTWVNGARSNNVEYQNTSGRKRRIATSLSGSSSSELNAQFSFGASSPASNTIGILNSSNANAGDQHAMPFFFEVPAGWYYKMNVTLGTLGTVWEMDE